MLVFLISEMLSFSRERSMAKIFSKGSGFVFFSERLLFSSFLIKKKTIKDRAKKSSMKSSE